MRDFGVVCDTSVLTDRGSVEEVQEFFSNSGLYVPNSTYSWLSRSKLIEVRHQTVKYSLISQMVRDRKLYPILLPEIYNELARQIMFEVDHKVALTDLRGLFLAAHLQLPILTFDEQLVERISEEIGIQTVGSFEAHANWLAIRDVLELYREISFDSGRCFQRQLEDGGNFPRTVREIENSFEERFSTTEESVEEVSQGQTNPGTLEFRYIFWDIIPSVREYHDQNIVPPETIRGICERAVLLVARPLG